MKKITILKTGAMVLTIHRMDGKTEVVTIQASILQHRHLTNILALMQYG